MPSRADRLMSQSKRLIRAASQWIHFPIPCAA